MVEDSGQDDEDDEDVPDWVALELVEEPAE
jgi:hypothetical protein